tara:strand:- start:275 stop:394 length:120 start_codon:yes stop_codon:yes gene_type:complete
MMMVVVVVRKLVVEVTLAIHIKAICALIVFRSQSKMLEE